jgi:SbsC C-terminal domain/Bacterial SH3 domain/Transglycosylase SLT domain
MKKRKAFKTMLSASLLVPAVAAVSVQTTEAATMSQIERAVQKSISTSQVLRRACSIESNGDGKTRPYKEYNAAKAAYHEAVKLVNSLPYAKKQIYLAKLDEPQLQLKRAAYYIDAITAGKKIEEKKKVLESHVKQGILTNETVKAYYDLSYEMKKQTALLDRVYGTTTRNAIKEYFKKPAERLKEDVSYAVTVKTALLNIESLPSVGKEEELLKEAKKVLLFLETIPQPSYQKSLTESWLQMKHKIPANVQDEEYKTLNELNDRLRELKNLVKPGVSNEKVPVLYENILTLSSKVKNETAKVRFKQTLQKEMQQLILPAKELKQLLTSKAIENGIPPEIVKSIAITESGKFQQFEENGEVFKSKDNGYGIMQVTPLSEHDKRFDWNSVKYDLGSNIDTGIKILLEKWNYSGKITPVVNDGRKEILENWYFAIMAYNGLSKKNDPNYSDQPYQVKVYENMKKYTLANPQLIDKADLSITYNESTGKPVFSHKMKYSTSRETKSTQLYKVGDQINITGSASFRDRPSTLNNKPVTLPAGTKVTIIGGPIEDENMFNLFTWYKVKINQTGQVGYIASVNLK